MLLFVASPTDAGSEARDPIPRLRTADRRVRALIAQGIAGSPTFRALTSRLEQSDVVVYVECGRRDRREPGGGRLIFVSSAGGFRYVVVRLGWLSSPAQQIAMLAHELQHAVEIADTPAIVDPQSMADAYRRMAGAREVARAGRTAFDTRAANTAGEQVLRELSVASGD